MRKLLYILLIFTFSISATAQGSGIGIGLSGGVFSSGLSAKYWLSDSKFISLHLGSGSSLSLDYLIDNPELLKITDTPTPVYYGAGLALRADTDNNGKDTFNIGVQGVIGLAYYLPSLPLDIYIESRIGFGTNGFYPGSNFGFHYFF